VQHKHRKIRLEEHVFGGAAEHELAEPVAAVGAQGGTFDLRWCLVASRALCGRAEELLNRASAARLLGLLASIANTNDWNPCWFSVETWLSSNSTKRDVSALGGAYCGCPLAPANLEAS
jgi:hypothetical protein